MGEEEEMDSSNYFQRLRQVLSLPVGRGRLAGMEEGREEPLWQSWVTWLQQQGYTSTARQGKGGQKYINYPISQALLRSSDKNKLHWLFADKQWSREWDAETLMAYVRHEVPRLTRHLQELITSPGLRYLAVTAAIHELYEAWRQKQPGFIGYSAYHSGTGAMTQTDERTSTLITGLYRTEDGASMQVALYLYPHAPQHRRIGQVTVAIDGTIRKLVEDRPGRYLPVAQVTEQELSNGARYKIHSPADFEWMVLPKRDFWLLAPDPENPESGVYASWGAPSLGSYFIVLCRERLVQQLQNLREERLIQWSGEPEPLWESVGWVEIRDCRVLSGVWSGLAGVDHGLYEALRPKTSLHVSVSGGLHAQGGGWLEGYGPLITVFRFQEEGAEHKAEVRIERTLNGRTSTVYEGERPTNKPFAFSWPGVGDYRVEAHCEGEIAPRLVKIISWDELPMMPPEQPENIKLGEWVFAGAASDRAQVGSE
jgi:hypothetical protein